MTQYYIIAYLLIGTLVSNIFRSYYQPKYKTVLEDFIKTSVLGVLVWPISVLYVFGKFIIKGNIEI